MGIEIGDSDQGWGIGDWELRFRVDSRVGFRSCIGDQYWGFLLGIKICTWDRGLGLGIRIQNWNMRFVIGLGFGFGDWNSGLGIMDWYWHLGFGLISGLGLSRFEIVLWIDIKEISQTKAALSYWTS